MKQPQDSEDLIERFLLGELSATERTAVENEYLVDRAGYDQICKIEDDLLDRYARGALSPADRERVERQYLTNPWRRRHLEFAKDLAQVIDEEPRANSGSKRTTSVSWSSKIVSSPRGLPGALRLISGSAALLIIFGVTWFAIETSRLRARLGEARREVDAQQQLAQTQARQITDLEAQHRRLTEERDRLMTQLQAAEKPESSPSYIASIFLTLSVEDVRSSGAQGSQTLVIPHGVAVARLRLYLPENVFPAYRVTLLTMGGSEVFSKSGLRPRTGKAGNFVIVNLPAIKLANEDNILTLSGINASGEADPLGKTLIKVRRR